jgi:hypothetical protein
MFKSSNPRVEAIVRVIQMNGCMIDGVVISLDRLPELCSILTDTDKTEIKDLIQSLENELEEYIADLEYADNEIQSLDPDLEDELEENRSDKDLAER